jgi:monoamine oxidase
MHKTGIVIVGAGLAGLYAAHLLEKKGVKDTVLLEARKSPGGRIVSTLPEQPALPDAEMAGVDLGPSWFWPDFQHQMAELVQTLGLQAFAQFEQGDMLIERSSAMAAQRVQGFVNSPPSMRLVGGMQALTQALYHSLENTRVILGQPVQALHMTASNLDVQSQDAQGERHTLHANHVLLAIPPRLAANLAFSPALPVELSSQWQNTPTWMAPHAKYVALFDTPFWRAQGLSGEARSLSGPLGEIHDASMPDGKAALFGFFNTPAAIRQRMGSDVLIQECRAQLSRLFGPQAAHPDVDTIKDWANEPYTTTQDDRQASSGQHPTAPAIKAQDGAWSGRLIGIGSEWGQQFPGYLAGAVEAAEAGVSALFD